MPPRAR